MFFLISRQSQHWKSSLPRSEQQPYFTSAIWTVTHQITFFCCLDQVWTALEIYSLSYKFGAAIQSLNLLKCQTLHSVAMEYKSLLFYTFAGICTLFFFSFYTSLCSFLNLFWNCLKKEKQDRLWAWAKGGNKWHDCSPQMWWAARIHDKNHKKI